MKIKVYIYDLNKIINNPNLIDVIKNHTNNYKHDEKRIISESNYYYALKKLEELNANINSFRFQDNKPIIDDFYISFSHTTNYFGFTISKQDNGFDIEKIIDEKRQDRIAKKILKDEYYNNYINSNNKGYYLTKIWTEFESSGKMLGTGLDYKFNHLDFFYKSFMIDEEIFTICSILDFELEIYVNDILRGDLIGKC